MSFLKGGADIPSPEQNPMTDEEMVLLKKLAEWVTKKGFTVPAILFLESVKPLNYIGSQTLVFFEPMIQTVFNFRDYDILRTAMEKRPSIEILIRLIEEYDVDVLARERRIKKYLKTQRKNWKWYQRYLGIFTPRTPIPEKILNPPESNLKNSPH